MNTAPVRARRRRRPARPRASPVLAAIDLGTNNCRLLVATMDDGSRIDVVSSFSRIVRLGEGVGQTGLLSEAAIARTVAALKICARQVRRSHAVQMRAIVTEAARQARNADVLIARAKKEAGIDLEIVSTDEEARLAAIGCAPLIGRDFEGALIFDIGGGSTELIWMQGHGAAAHVLHAASVPLGVVTLGERVGLEAPLAEFKRAVSAELDTVRRGFDAAGAFALATHHLLGTSGTVTTLAGIALGLEHYERSKVDASWHDSQKILAIVDYLGGLDLKARADIGCVGHDRADLIVPGCAILAAIHALWPCERLRVADRGLREGILRELAAGNALS